MKKTPHCSGFLQIRALLGLLLFDFNSSCANGCGPERYSDFTGEDETAQKFSKVRTRSLKLTVAEH